MPENLTDLLKQARKHYKRGERRKGAYLIEKILRQDFMHPGAWELLYEYYGSGQSFEEFQPAFAQKYYPDKIDLLKPQKAVFTSTVEEEKRGSFLGRLVKAFFALFSSSRESKEDLNLDISSVKAAEKSPSAENQPSGDARKEQVTHHPSQAPQRETHPGSFQQPPASTYVPPKLDDLASAHLRSRPTYIATPSQDKIRIIIVDDIAQTRENIVRSLSFQSNVEIVGTATNGKDGIRLAVEEQPDVVLMDVNMPDMDGITATAGVRKAVPTAQIVILTVQDDVDYMRRAMMAGARDFLTKPPMIDELVTAVNRAGEIAHQEKAKLLIAAAAVPVNTMIGRGRIITVYSPKGGAGCTTIASNLAVALHNEETQVVVVDGNLEYGDVSVLFNEHSKKTVIDLASRAGELDPEIVEDVVITHKSGIKVLAAPRPEHAEIVTSEQFAEMLKYLSTLYPYVIVDTATRLNDINFAAFDTSDIILVITTQDIPAIGNVRKFLDLVKALKIPSNRLMLMMNQYDKRINISPAKISQSYQQEMSAVISLDSPVVQPSINRGLPFMLQKDILARPIAREMYTLAEAVRKRLKEQDKENSSIRA
jgi:pilus assembly protein CpaE